MTDSRVSNAGHKHNLKRDITFMKQVIDNLNDFVTYMAVNYTTMPFDDIVIFDAEEADKNDARLSGATADIIPFQCSTTNR